MNYSGTWIFNEEKSEVGKNGTGNIPHEIAIDQDGDLLHVKKVLNQEWGEDQTTFEDIPLDGSEMKSEVFNSPRISTTSWNEDSKSVKISSTMKFTRAGQTTERKSNEVWSLNEGSKFLKIVQTSNGFRGGETTVTLIYGKQ